MPLATQSLWALLQVTSAPQNSYACPLNVAAVQDEPPSTRPRGAGRECPIADPPAGARQREQRDADGKAPPHARSLIGRNSRREEPPTPKQPIAGRRVWTKVGGWRLGQCRGRVSGPPA